MKSVVPDDLTERHLMLFGAIVQWFACHELLVTEIMASVSGSNTACVMLLTRGLNISGKRAALHGLLRHREVPLDQFDRIHAYLQVLNTYDSLLNDILHTAWIPRKSPNSIQPDWILRPPPTIRPMHADTDTPATEFVENDEDRVSYTVEALAEIAETLAWNHERFSSYLKDVGLIQRHVDVR